jgi:pimeloyl-ACP methyl ester carboxylesterase
MTNKVSGFLLPWLLLTTYTALGQLRTFDVGYRVIRTYDSSRIYKPLSQTTDSLHFRPIDIDLWYPATPGPSDTPLTFSDLLRDVEKRSNFYDDTQRYHGLAQELLQYFCQGLDCPDCNTLANAATHAYPNAKPVRQKFPLVVYLSSFNGMGYENYALLKALAQEGFIVASISSVGRYPGNMTMAIEDLLEQVQDAMFAIRHVPTTEADTTAGVSLLGYSWGGLAAAALAMNESAHINALVSLDGSEQLTYTGENDDKFLQDIRNSKYFHPEKIRSPFLYLDRDTDKSENAPDSLYNFIDFASGEKCYLKIQQATHEDFSSLTSLCAANGKSRHDLITTLTVNFLLEKSKNTRSFYSSIPATGVDRSFHRPAPPPITVQGTQTITGMIRDKGTTLPLSYVNIGIMGKDQGTTSDVSGAFKLTLRDTNPDDTLRISLIGYQPVKLPAQTLFDQRTLPLRIDLTEAITPLNEVTFTSPKMTTRVLGRHTESKFLGGKFAPGDLGSEMAFRVKIKKSPTYLETFSFNISYNTGDTATFRVNIYTSKNGLPADNILTQNIIVKINGQAGKIQVDLSKYNIEVTDDFFIGLEWIEGKRNSGIVFSSALGINSSTYYKKASQGHWRKHKIAVGFNVTAKY